MSELEDLFEEALIENGITPEPLTIAEKVVKRAEEEFRGYGEEEQLRIDEETEIREKIKSLELQFQKNKNIKNYRLSELNAKRAEKRKEIKKKISILKIRLQEIDDEREDNSKRTT